MQRQQKDHDIARMNALTNAVQFLSAFQDRLEAETEISDLALKVAGKFYTWIMNGQTAKADPVQDKVDEIREEVAADPQMSEAEYELALFKKHAVNRKKLYQQLNELELKDSQEGQWLERSPRTFGASKGDPYPISKKQYGFLMGLHKEAGVEPDKPFITCLSTDGASAMIDLLNQLCGKENGNGNGRGSIEGSDLLKIIKQQIKDRGLRATG